ncbi:hypothetical protein [Brevundimonas sp.]|uniref:hypothetical protein n=1 Tax=Brevundimonas sp. TaxID=1871086 RepID=UPI002EDA6CE3
MSRSIWTTLGITSTNDVDEIRRAYARRLKQVHPEDDPEGFQALRAAYDQASSLARNGWAAPRPLPPGGEDDQDDPYDDADDVWPDEAGDRWRPAAGYTPRGWAPPEGDRWTRPEPVEQAAAEADLPDDIRAELARERDLAEAHQALCDQLTALVARADGDRHEALSAMIRIFRSPAMDSLTTYARTEQWLAQVVGFGGPVVDEMVEPAIQFFGWESSRVGIDLRHAEPVLRRREAGLLLRRLERRSAPENEAWRALTERPTPISRVRERLTPRLAGRIESLLQRLEHEHPEIIERMNPEALARWRARQTRPVLAPVFLWILIIAPPVAAMMLNSLGDFGPPTLPTFFAFWTVIGSTLLAAGAGYVYGVSRPRAAWSSSAPWHRPLWQRFGWAPAALLLPVVAGVAPPAWWLPLCLLPISLGLWAWVRITTSHVLLPYGSPRDWSRYAGIAPVLGYLMVQGDVVGQAGTALLVAFVGAALVLQIGAEAIADEIAQWGPVGRRRIGAAGMAAVAITAVAVTASASSGRGMAAACGLVIAVALADRALIWSRTGPFVVPRRFLMLGGWLGALAVAAFLPFTDFAVRAFIGLSFWLLAAAVLTAVDGLFDGRTILPHWFGRRKNRRAPGDLA